MPKTPRDCGVNRFHTFLLWSTAATGSAGTPYGGRREPGSACAPRQRGALSIRMLICFHPQQSRHKRLRNAAASLDDELEGTENESTAGKYTYESFNEFNTHECRVSSFEHRGILSLCSAAMPC
jgi:hypothetical protein